VNGIWYNDIFRLRKKTIEDSEILEIGTTSGEVIFVSALVESSFLVERNETKFIPDVERDYLRGGSDIGGGG
jgi:hypothetical protein